VINRRRAILSLRVVMTLAVAATTLPHLRSPKGLALSILIFYGLSNLLLLSEKASSRLQRLPPAALFIFDLAVVISLMLLTGETHSQFYVVFFLIILMAALARSARAATAIACVSAFIYGLLEGIREPEELLRIEFTTQIALFFVTALFAGYLAEEVHTEQIGRASCRERVS
jgi:K+-sensing histidine kinase KdpD